MNKDLNNLNKSLNEYLSKKREKDIMGDKQSFIKEVTIEVAKVFKPILDALVMNSKMSKDEIKGIAEEIANKINIPEINIPEILLPEINIPKTQVDVRVPDINISDIVQKIKMPDEMSIKGWVQLMGVDLGHPLPVQLRDKDGKPVNLLENLTTLVSQGGGGGKHDYLTIKGFSQSSFSELTNADGRIKVSVETGGNGLTDAELRASSVPVEQVSGSSWSTYVTGIFNSTTADVINPDNRIRVSVETGGSGLTNAELRASSVPVAQVSGASWSTEATIVGTPTVTVSGSIASTGSYLINGDGVYRDTLPVQGTVAVSGITNSVGATILNGEGLARDTWGVSQVGTWNITGITNSTASAIVDSSGVQYSGTNPVPVVMVAGSVSSTVVVGATASDSQDNDSAPVKIGGIARTANPTPVSAGGDAVSASFDTIGRQIIRPVQVRGLLITAYTSLTNGTETTLLAGSASTYHDLVYIMGANSSDVAVLVDLRCGTAGSVVQTIQIPASGTAGVSLTTPIPMPEAAQAWTADMGDITGTTVYLTGLFSKEV